MLNPNIFIIGAFGITGIAITLWGLMLIIKARKMRNWSRVEGVIADNMITPHADDLPPQIRFNYSVDGHVYTGTLDIPNSIALSDEVSASYQENIRQVQRFRFITIPSVPITPLLNQASAVTG